MYRMWTFIVLFVCGFVFRAPDMVFALEAKSNTLSLSMDGGYYLFKGNAIREKGLVYGMDAAYIYRGNLVSENLPKGMIKVNGKIIVGRLDFQGGLFDQNTYSADRVKNYIGEVRGVAGYDFSVFSSTTLTPYLGLGYLNGADHLEKINAGYRRISNYLYSPIGFETRTPVTQGWSIGFVGEYDLFWHGWQETYLSDLDPLFSDETNSQSRGYGLKSSIKIRKEMDDKNIVFEPYAEYWNIRPSESKIAVYNGVPVPPGSPRVVANEKSGTLTTGIRVGVEF